MKQPVLDKLVSDVKKELARKHAWKFSRGFIFKKSGDLFFSIIGYAGAKSNNVHQMLQYKMLAFDELFWKITRLEENSKKPLSFRACGAWVAPLTTVHSANRIIDEWTREEIRMGVELFIDECNSIVENLSEQIRSPAENLRFLEENEARQRLKYPGGGSNIWCDRLMTALLEGTYDLAEQIIDDRRRHGDAGGFLVGGRTFFELADEYIHTPAGE